MLLERLRRINNLSENDRISELKLVIKKYNLFDIEIKEDFRNHLEFIEGTFTDIDLKSKASVS